VFCYWINQKTYLIDYIAYANGGPRFRKATTRHKAGDIIVQDYENYEIKDKTILTSDYDRVYREGGAKLLSKIEHTNVRKLN
jgi:Iap family predicted aminopeptidase